MQIKTPAPKADDAPGWFCMSPVAYCVASGSERGKDVPVVCPKCGRGPVAVTTAQERGR